jgi:peptidoglycan-N-acetylglucosamine deacetylase
MPRDSITVILGFDMETDVGSWTPFYEGLTKGTPILMDLLAEKGVRSTCYFVGQAAADHPQVVREVQAAGHEVGCHSLFHETVGDPLFPIPNLPRLLDSEVKPRLRRATELVAAAAGRVPVSFRCPRLFGSTAVCNALEELGYVSDASFPMYHYGEPFTPYHPSRGDWTKPGDLRLIEIPNFANLAIESHDPYGRDRDQWPLFRTEGAEALLKHVDQFVAYCRERRAPAVLCFYFHPWEFWPMPQGAIHFGEGSVVPDEFLVRNCGEVAVREMGNLLDGLKARGARFQTARECAGEWA